MKKIIISVILIALGAFVLFSVWAKYNYVRNIETAAESKENIVGMDKKDVLSKLGNPAAWGAVDDAGGGHRKEVLLYTTWSKNMVIVLRDDKVVKVKLRAVRKPPVSEVRSVGDFKSWVTSAVRLLFGKQEAAPAPVEQQ
jgi:hypothetical protein